MIKFLIIYTLITSYTAGYYIVKLHPSTLDSPLILLFLAPIIVSALINSCCDDSELIKELNLAKKKLEDAEDKEYMQLEKEKLKLENEKLNSEILTNIKNGKVKFTIPMKVLEQITNGLKESDIYVSIEYPDIIFSDCFKQYTYKTATTEKKVIPTTRQTVYEKPYFSMRIDRKKLASSLRVLSDNIVEMSFDMNNNGIFTFKDRKTTVNANIGR